MLPSVPELRDYNISEQNGFLPVELPLECLPDAYYKKWETVVTNFQALILSKRLREVIENLPVLSTTKLQDLAEWRRAYVVLSFMTHGYIWGGDKPQERVPPPISIPFLQVCDHLGLPPVATYAGVCLWNFKPIFNDEPFDDLGNLATLVTFTGSIDESWFYLVSVAIESCGAPLLPIMLDAIKAARRGDAETVTQALQIMAEHIDEIGGLLNRMYEQCDPHIFYHRIRPFLAGSKNMAEAGLPNGVIFDTGLTTDHYVQYGGGSNAQSSLIQFFDIILGVEHRPTGVAAPASKNARSVDNTSEATSPPSPSHNFIMDMRSYMPGPHRQFLSDVTAVANIREFVASHRGDRALVLAYDACLAMLRTLRDKHIQVVTRYIIVKSRESRSVSPRQPVPLRPKVNLANVRSEKNGDRNSRSKLRGTGGTALIPFLKQARDETGEPAIDNWARRLLSDTPAASGTTGHGRIGDKGRGGYAVMGGMDEHADGHTEVVGLAGTWSMDDSEGGICHW